MIAFRPNGQFRGYPRSAGFDNDTLANLPRRRSFPRLTPRQLSAEDAPALVRQAPIALVAPRQGGKTAVAVARNALYLDRDDRNRLANPALFPEMVEDRLVIRDEIHRLPPCHANGGKRATCRGQSWACSAR